MPCSNEPVTVIGGGLAGCEAAWQLSKSGFKVILYEMRPTAYTPAHKTSHLAELVCSNSLRSRMIQNAAGLLKEEMRLLGSLVMEAADATSVPAGGAIAVDRDLFSCFIEDRLSSSPGVEILRREVTAIPDECVVIIASGPLTSKALSDCISAMTGRDHIYFYDAISPIVTAESIAAEKTFRASRYDGGEGDYLNCPMTEEEYGTFYRALLEGKEVPLRDFEDVRYFEGCLPVEVMAKRGLHTLRYGPMKPVGLIDPRTGTKPYAVVQLRRENRCLSLFNLVGFQTKLTWPEQGRIFRMIPGLENAEFARYGSIHRNTFLRAPALLNNTLQLRSRENVFFAGQITGVEGYIESAATGMAAGIFAGRLLQGKDLPAPPRVTALGALLHYLEHADPENFQPMNVNFGLFPALAGKTRRRDRGLLYAERAIAALASWKEKLA